MYQVGFPATFQSIVHMTAPANTTASSLNITTQALAAVDTLFTLNASAMTEQILCTAQVSMNSPSSTGMGNATSDTTNFFQSIFHLGDGTRLEPSLYPVAIAVAFAANQPNLFEAQFMLFSICLHFLTNIYQRLVGKTSEAKPANKAEKQAKNINQLGFIATESQKQLRVADEINVAKYDFRLK